MLKRILSFGTLLVIGMGSASGQTVEQRAGEEVVVLNVAHIERGENYCFGELVISRYQVIYTVQQPASKESHSFELPVSSIREAIPGEQVDLRYVELRLGEDLPTKYFHSAVPGDGGLTLDATNPAIFAAAAAITDFDAAVEALNAGSIKPPTGPPPPPEIDLAEEAIKYLVAHSDAEDTYCYGWLSISRDKLSYEVVWPREKSLHRWTLDRRDVVSAQTVDRNNWRWIEIKPRSGSVQAFASAQEAGFGYYMVRPHQFDIHDAVRTFENFDQEWAQLEKRTTVVDETCKGTVWIRSEPSGAEVYVDGDFVGSTPAKLTLNAGLRKIQVQMEGQPEWVREVKITCDANINLPVKWTPP
jgi:hypothetical protein